MSRGHSFTAHKVQPEATIRFGPRGDEDLTDRLAAVWVEINVDDVEVTFFLDEVENAVVLLRRLRNEADDELIHLMYRLGRQAEL